ncbi:MAG: hypothetical protein IIA67_14415 [Planctomycetes bacterium]|nr:hypothetical protein [Planctomycetota bacterium]
MPVAVGATPLTTVRIATGLERPIYLTSSPGDASRLYVLEKHGRIRLIKNGVVLSDPFLDIKALIDGGGRGGEYRPCT